MFCELNLKNFKAFEKLSIELKPLTFLLGPNNSGKSSILAALRLLNQTVESRDSSVSLLLDGKQVADQQFLRKKNGFLFSLCQKILTHEADRRSKILRQNFSGGKNHGKKIEFPLHTASASASADTDIGCLGKLCIRPDQNGI